MFHKRANLDLFKVHYSPLEIPFIARQAIERVLDIQSSSLPYLQHQVSLELRLRQFKSVLNITSRQDSLQEWLEALVDQQVTTVSESSPSGRLTSRLRELETEN